MQRDEISTIFPEATAEQVEAVMALHGRSTTELRQQLATANGELTTLRAAPDHATELATANSTIETLTAQLNELRAADSIRQTREKVAAAKNIPANLLTGKTEEACTAQADAILAFARPGYPTVKDGGGGKAGAADTSTRAQFANWVKDNNL